MKATKLINCDLPTLSRSRDFFAAVRHSFPISANSRVAQFLKYVSGDWAAFSK
jgi:hypothetical protein